MFRLHILIGGVWILLTNFCVYKSVCIPIGVEEPVSKISVSPLLPLKLCDQMDPEFTWASHLGVRTRLSG